jgi:hypothetical protein
MFYALIVCVWDRFVRYRYLILLLLFGGHLCLIAVEFGHFLKLIVLIALVLMMRYAFLNCLNIIIAKTLKNIIVP